MKINISLLSVLLMLGALLMLIFDTFIGGVLTNSLFLKAIFHFLVVFLGFRLLRKNISDKSESLVYGIVFIILLVFYFTLDSYLKTSLT